MKLAQRIVLTYYTLKFRALALISPEKAAKSAFELFCTPYTRRRTYETPEVFKDAEKQTFKFQGHDIHGFAWTPNVPNGFKILICHGFDSLSYRFERYIEPLLNEGFEIFAFDAPAHGLSTGKTINAIVYRDLILEIYDKYGPFDGIMAHSFGGIAVMLAIEKIKGDMPKRLVLIAPATETTRSITDFCRHLKITSKLRRELEKLILHLSGQTPEWFSVARVIQSVSIPTLWVHDKKDRITPYEDMHHLTEKSLSHVEFLITEGLGHSLYKDATVANRIEGFFASLKNNVY
jgi:alpha-beta hydrolase superfamily lysophospholipase